MDEIWLHGLLERATDGGPPADPAAVARNSLRAGVQLRRRRRRRRAAGVVVVTMISAAALVVTGAAAHPTAVPVPVAGASTVYVVGGGKTIDTVTPIPARTGQAVVIRAATNPLSFATTQLEGVLTGKTIWVSDGGNWVTPVSTVTNRAGTPIRLLHKPGRGTGVVQLLAAPDGRTIYVLDAMGVVIPVSTATRRAGRPVRLASGDSGEAEMAITPDGKTLYVAMSYNLTASYVLPIATATGRPGKRITVAAGATAIVAAPDGKTVYVIGEPPPMARNFSPTRPRGIQVTPIATSTNRPGRSVLAGKGNLMLGTSTVTTHGQTMYLAEDYPDGVIPFSMATNRPGKLIGFGSALIDEITITPDGRTAYVTSQPAGGASVGAVPGDGGGHACTGATGDVTPIATATSTAGKPIKVGCLPLAAAVTPDGQTLYVGSMSGTVTPIATATGRPGTPVKIEWPGVILAAP